MKMGAFLLRGGILAVAALMVGACAAFPIGYIHAKGMNEVGAALIAAGGSCAIAVIAAAIAIWAILAQRSTAKAQASLDYLARGLYDKDIIAARAAFGRLSKAHNDLSQFADPIHDGGPDTTAIDLVLNDYELIAIGIQRGIIDCELFKMWNKTAVTFTWRHAKPYADAVRRRANRSAIFVEVERMAVAFENNQPFGPTL